MKNLIVVLLLAFTFSSHSFATHPDTLDFTIVAPSGLSLRTAPYLSAERLDVLPYGTSVKTVGHWEDIYSLERMDTVDTRAGYWVETEYDGKRGFLFSGYMKNGPLYVPPTEINNNFRITAPGERCQAINYDPALNWYGIYLDPENGNSKVKAVDMNIEQGIFDEELEEMAYADMGDFMTVKALQEDSFLMFFGTSEPINTNDLAFEESYFKNLDMEHWDPQGKFIYPYERVQIAQEGYDQYYLVGHESISVNENPENFEDAITKKYSIYLSDNQGGIAMSNGDTLDLGKEFHTEHLDVYQYSTYLGPRLVWQGDVNNDGFPDVIFYMPYMAECCGGSESYHLLVSKKVDGLWRLEKVAEDEVFGCYGC